MIGVHGARGAQFRREMSRTQRPCLGLGTDVSPGSATVVYDGDCPFCSRYVTLLRLNVTLGPVALVNAREGGPLVDRVRQRGLDLDDGMVLVLNGDFHHGADCIHRLALLSTPSDLFNRLNSWIFRSPAASRALYPLLRTSRNIVLVLLGRRKMGVARHAGSDHPR
jgi:predicted DCC family thiol-disulfide oxidoreductase YuxK